MITTYLIPVQLVTVAWDGWLSVIKSKNINQYKELLSGFNDNQYSIEAKKIQQLQGNLIVIIAKPVSS